LDTNAKGFEKIFPPRKRCGRGAFSSGRKLRSDHSILQYELDDHDFAVSGFSSI